MAEDFLETDYGKLLATANRFLVAAKIIVDSDEWKTRPRRLLTPALHLTAHGIEVLLKANLVGGGLTLEEVRSSFGHDINSLWNDVRNQPVRRQVEFEARLAWERARDSGQWQDDFSVSDDPVLLLNEYIGVLNTLHTRKTDYALRYVAAEGLEGPRPNLLVDAFLAAADFCLRQPNTLLP